MSILDAANLLLRARRAADLTQEAVAKLASLSVRSLTDYERGKKSPPVDTFERILVACGVKTFDHLSRLVTGDNVKARRPTERTLTEELQDKIREVEPGRSSAYYRDMAALLERVERLERMSGAGE